MPIEKIYYWKEANNYWIDEEFLQYIEDILGERRILLSAGLWAHCYGKNYIRHGEQVLADSGGFQYLRMGKGKQRDFYTNREKYYKWQLDIGDIVVMGDIPSAGEVPADDLKRYLGITKENVDYQMSLDSNLGSRLLGVMHGISPDCLRLWYKGMKDYQMMGWAIGAKPVSNFVGFALQFLFLYEMGEFDKKRFIHVFGVAGKQTLFPLVELIRKIDKDLTISLDSSSQSLARYGGVWDKDGTIIHYDEIRNGSKKFKLLDGSDLTTVPRKVGYDLGRKIAHVSAVNYLKMWKREVFPVLESGEFGDEDEGKRVTSQVNKVYKLWKLGGVDAVWHEYKNKWTDENTQRLV